MSQKFLVLLDTDRIKDYVFATNKLREIRGASAILDELNLESTYQVLKAEFGEGNYEKENGEWKYNSKPIEDEDDNIYWQVMFLGGGSGKILFAEGNKAREFCRRIQEIYREKTDNAASITAVVVPQLSGECCKHWIYRGEKELHKQKDSKCLRVQPLTNHYFKICESTGLFPAEEISRSDKILICRASFQKRKAAKQSRSYFAKFQKWLIEQQDETLRAKWKKLIETDISDEEKWVKLLPEDLGSIGSFSNGYVGFIYADGNRMGERLAELDKPDKYRDFSDAVKNGIQEAMFQTLAEHLGKDFKQNQEHIPFEILLLGGDDLMVVVPANKAVEIARDFCEDFKLLTPYRTESGEETNVSICAGVLITHVNYPIHRMIDHAEDLLKSAKELSYKKYRETKADNKPEKDWEVNAVDFMVLKGALLQDVKEMRSSELSYSSDAHPGYSDLILYQRPYNIDKLNELINWIRRFKKSGFPRNKLKSMYESLYRGKGQATLDCLLITSRLPQFTDGGESPRKVMLDFWKEDGLEPFPWKPGEVNGKYVTPFLDLIELYDFIEENQEAQSG